MGARSNNDLSSDCKGGEKLHKKIKVIRTMKDLKEFAKNHKKKKVMKLELKDLIFQDPEKNKMIERR